MILCYEIRSMVTLHPALNKSMHALIIPTHLLQTSYKQAGFD